MHNRNFSVEDPYQEHDDDCLDKNENILPISWKRNILLDVVRDRNHEYNKFNVEHWDWESFCWFCFQDVDDLGDLHNQGSKDNSIS